MRTSIRAALVGAAVLPLAAITPGLAFAGEAAPGHDKPAHSEDSGDHHKGKHKHDDGDHHKGGHGHDCGCHVPPAPPRGGGLPVPTPPLDPTALLALLAPAAVADAPAPTDELSVQ